MSPPQAKGFRRISLGKNIENCIMKLRSKSFKSSFATEVAVIEKGKIPRGIIQFRKKVKARVLGNDKDRDNQAKKSVG